MITKGQAEQAFYERYLQPQSTVKPQIRNVQLEQIDTALIETEENIYPFDLAAEGWKCIFEIRYRKLFLGEWRGGYEEWCKDTCYIVEPQPGIYVID